MKSSGERSGAPNLKSTRKLLKDLTSSNVLKSAKYKDYDLLVIVSGRGFALNLPENKKDDANALPTRRSKRLGILEILQMGQRRCHTSCRRYSEHRIRHRTCHAQTRRALMQRHSDVPAVTPGRVSRTYESPRSRNGAEAARIQRPWRHLKP